MVSVTRRRLITVAAMASAALAAGRIAQAAPLQLPEANGSQTGKGANAWLEISPRIFAENIGKMKRLLADAHSKAQICAVMKADAYGHGIALLMPAIKEAGIPCIGFTSNAEARVVSSFLYGGRLTRLRTATLEEIAEAIPYGAEEIIGSLIHAQAIDKLAEASNSKISVHLCINAGGMSRNGIELALPSGMKDALQIARLPHLEIVGLMTHFPSDDVGDVETVLATFNSQAADLVAKAKLDRSALRLHAANSFAALSVAASHLDMVRVGGALYGDTVPSPYQFQRMMAFKTTVGSVNAYKQGETVSYDRTYTLTRDCRLANIPVGYSDGYNRKFSSLSHVLIRGHRVPCVGRVSMNTFMVDVTDYPDVAEGDEVVLYGKDAHNNEISQSELEEASGTIGVEFESVWGLLNPRRIALGG